MDNYGGISTGELVIRSPQLSGNPTSKEISSSKAGRTDKGN
jgi:hypothetical protein